MTTLGTTTRPETVTEPDGRVSQYFDLPYDEDSLFRLFKLLFEEHASEITFGPCVQGAVFEIRVEKPGELTMLDGYLTVDFGTWHFHLCIGEHRGTTASPCPPELAHHRRVKRAALFRTRGKSCLPVSWGLRLWNGHDEQMVTVFFPNPYLDQDGHRPRQADWSRLPLWDFVRREFLGLEPDPSDRE
ncbi:MAG TPA: hypothetical protein VG826_12115 [Pirellulales bacterium]|nr:hypothetical protein [Pirellulales bacterium]